METSPSALVILFAAFLVACLALIAFMFVSLAKQGDERRRAIVGKAASASFFIVMGSLVLRIAMRFAGLPLESDGAVCLFSTLATSSLVFTIALACYRKRYGG